MASKNSLQLERNLQRGRNIAAGLSANAEKEFNAAAQQRNLAGAQSSPLNQEYDAANQAVKGAQARRNGISNKTSQEYLNAMDDVTAAMRRRSELAQLANAEAEARYPLAPLGSGQDQNSQELSQNRTGGPPVPANLGALNRVLRNNGQNSIGALVNSISTKVNDLLLRARALKGKISAINPATITPDSLAGIIQRVNGFKDTIRAKLATLGGNTDALTAEMGQIDTILRRILGETVATGSVEAAGVANQALAEGVVVGQAPAPPAPAPAPAARQYVTPFGTTMSGSVATAEEMRDDYATSYNATQNLTTVLADVERNIWKKYVYPSAGSFTVGTPLTNEELTLVKYVVSRLRTQLGTGSVDDKKNSLYTAFGENPSARAFLEHTIRYFTEKFPEYKALSQTLLTTGVLVKDGGTPSLPANKDTISRNSTLNGYLSKSKRVPIKEENDLGWNALFNFIEGFGSQPAQGGQRQGGRRRSKSKSKSKSTRRVKTRRVKTRRVKTRKVKTNRK